VENLIKIKLDILMVCGGAGRVLVLVGACVMRDE